MSRFRVAALTCQLIYASGSIPLDPATMQVVEGGIEAQTVSWAVADCYGGETHPGHTRIFGPSLAGSLLTGFPSGIHERC